MVDFAPAQLPRVCLAANRSPEDRVARSCRNRSIQPLVLARPAPATHPAGLRAQGKRGQVRPEARQLLLQYGGWQLQHLADSLRISIQCRLARARRRCFGRHRFPRTQVALRSRETALDLGHHPNGGLRLPATARRTLPAAGHARARGAGRFAMGENSALAPRHHLAGLRGDSRCPSARRDRPHGGTGRGTALPLVFRTRAGRHGRHRFDRPSAFRLDQALCRPLRDSGLLGLCAFQRALRRPARRVFARNDRCRAGSHGDSAHGLRCT